MKLIFCLLFFFLIEMHYSKRLLRIPLRGSGRKMRERRPAFARSLYNNSYLPPEIGFSGLEIGSGAGLRKFEAQFDTGSDGLWVFSKFYDTCDANYYVVNEKHSLYDRTASPTYKPLKDSRPQLFFRGNGWVFGFRASDTIAIWGTRVDSIFVEVTKSSKYTANDRYNGTVGLQYNPTKKNFFTMICDQSQGKSLMFSVYYPNVRPINSDFSDGEFTFCGADRSKYIASSLVHVKIDENDHGTWRIPVDRLRLHDNRGDIQIASNIKILIDTATNRIYLPASHITTFYDQLRPYNPTASTEVNCNVVPLLPQIIFQISGVDFTLTSDAYTYKAQNGAAFTCIILVNQSPSGNWSIGEPIFRKYFTMFDAERHLIGFAQKP